MKPLLLAIAVMVMPSLVQAETYILSVHYKSCGRSMVATYRYRSLSRALAAKWAFDRNDRFLSAKIKEVR